MSKELWRLRHGKSDCNPEGWRVRPT